MFTGLSAFPLTPFNAQGIDEAAFVRLLNRLTAARVDSLGVLGSTGSYAYLSREQRQRVATLASQHAEGIPLLVCIGAIGTDQVLRLAEDAQQAGADALLLPAMSYQKLSDDEVFGLFETVTRHASLPVCVYDNPGTTHVTFSNALYGRIAALPGIASLKIPGVPADAADAAAHMQRLRAALPDGIAVGVSGDAFAAAGLNAGCQLWYSVIGGLFPHSAKALTDAAARGDSRRVNELNAGLEPLWALFRQFGGSLRVIAAAAASLGLTEVNCLPAPLQPLSAADRSQVAQVVSQLELR